MLSQTYRFLLLLKRRLMGYPRNWTNLSCATMPWETQSSPSRPSMPSQSLQDSSPIQGQQLDVEREASSAKQLSVPGNQQPSDPDEQVATKRPRAKRARSPSRPKGSARAERGRRQHRQNLSPFPSAQTSTPTLSPSQGPDAVLD
jgi:hypothetical protein